MGGGLLQLVAYGAQDAYLSGNPQITFWKGLYKRHTNFAMESFPITFSGQAAWNTKQSALLGRHADLLYSTYLEVVLEAGLYNNDQGFLGFNLIKYTELEIGGQLIDRLYGEFLYLWSVLTNPFDKLMDLTSMVSSGGFGSNKGASSGATTIGGQTVCGAFGGRPELPNSILYIPLSFFYCRSPAAALPLIALQYHEVRVNVHWNTPQLISGDFSQKGLQTLPAQPRQVTLYVDYIYLDVEERRRMAQESHEYLIEQTQFNEDKGITSYSNRIDLTFNHPVKELIWVVQPSYYTNCTLPRPEKLRPSVYTNKEDNTTNASFDVVATNGVYISVVPYNSQPTGSGWLVGQSVTILGTELGGSSPANDCTFRVAVVDTFSGAIVSVTNITGVATASNTPLQPRLTPFTFDQNAVYQQNLQINGQDRMSLRYGDYFGKVQRFQHHTGGYGFVESNGVYSYSFAIRPEEHQPSGTCNFSRIDTATLVINMSGAVDVGSNGNSWDVRVYAINYNILRVMSGMAGLAYSN